ncbi:MAG: MoaD/ThiS family protein [Actinomycetia bacterium]|nr:MoaD/ThiS family protein [Actinomycetes bacterium]
MTVAVSVHFSAELRMLTGGIASLELDAATVRSLIRQLDERYPGIGERLTTTGMAIAIDGDIVADALFEDLPDGAEVHFLPALSGG